MGGGRRQNNAIPPTPRQSHHVILAGSSACSRLFRGGRRSGPGPALTEPSAGLSAGLSPPPSPRCPNRACAAGGRRRHHLGGFAPAAGEPGSISLIGRIGNNSRSPIPPFGRALPFGARAGQSARGLISPLRSSPGRQAQLSRPRPAEEERRWPGLAAAGGTGRARSRWQPPALLLHLSLKWPRCRLFKLAHPERASPGAAGGRAERRGRKCPSSGGGGGEPRTGLGAAETEAGRGTAAGALWARPGAGTPFYARRWVFSAA
ncbi:unnamed protein product [Coccothraustes coccothraustes]